MLEWKLFQDASVPSSQEPLSSFLKNNFCLWYYEFESFPFYLHIMNHDWVWIYGTNKCFKPLFCPLVCLSVSKFLQSLDIGADSSILRKVDCTHHANSLYKLDPKCNAWFTFMGSLSHIIEKHYRFTSGFTWGTWIKINVYTQQSQ